MKSLLKTVLLVPALVFATGVFAADAAIVSPYGEFFIGDGVEVEMAEFVAKNEDGLKDVLLKMTGANAYNAGIDGKTIKYQAVPGGTGVDYQFEGKTRMLTRGDTWGVTEVYLDGKTISLQEDPERSKEVLPLHLLTASKQAAE